MPGQLLGRSSSGAEPCTACLPVSSSRESDWDLGVSSTEFMRGLRLMTPGRWQLCERGFYGFQRLGRVQIHASQAQSLRFLPLAMGDLAKLGHTAPCLSLLSPQKVQHVLIFRCNRCNSR